MFLKIVYLNKTKKVKFKEEWKSFEKLQQFISEYIKLPAKQFEIKFTDQEKEEITMVDEHDFEYFLECNLDSKFLIILIAEIKEPEIIETKQDNKSELIISVEESKSEIFIEIPEEVTID